MARFIVTRHSGAVVDARFSLLAAVQLAVATAIDTGGRVNVYPREDDSKPAGVRVCSCYPAAIVWESELAGLDHGAYSARHAAAEAGRGDLCITTPDGVGRMLAARGLLPIEGEG